MAKKAAKKAAKKRASKRNQVDEFPPPGPGGSLPPDTDEFPPPGPGGVLPGDGPTPPEHANLVKPKGSTECLNCGFVFAGRTNCSNCGFEMSDEQIAEINEHRKAAGLGLFKR